MNTRDNPLKLDSYTPRGKRSVWRQVNVDKVARLVAGGRMTPHGLAHVEADRRRKIEAFGAMPQRGETVHPQGGK